MINNTNMHMKIKGARKKHDFHKKKRHHISKKDRNTTNHVMSGAMAGNTWAQQVSCGEAAKNGTNA